MCEESREKEVSGKLCWEDRRVMKEGGVEEKVGNVRGWLVGREERGKVGRGLQAWNRWILDFMFGFHLEEGGCMRGMAGATEWLKMWATRG